MKCPLLIENELYPSGQTDSTFGNCIAGECAWWDEVKVCCGERTKRIQLERIAPLLEKIAKELTLIRPQ